MKRLAAFLLRLLTARIVSRRAPDWIIGSAWRPYLHRWWVIPRNPVCNIYLHRFLRSDDDRALHDHPWIWLSFLLQGEYLEHTIRAGGTHRRRQYRAGSLRIRLAHTAHRLELVGDECWTLFITGPRMRRWGFHRPQRWVPWREFTDPASGGKETGQGCDT